MKEKTHNNINKERSYYSRNGIEAWDVMTYLLGQKDTTGFNRCNVIKYVFRANTKHDTPHEDYKKAMSYAKRLHDDGEELTPLEQACLDGNFAQAETLIDKYTEEMCQLKKGGSES